MQTMPVVEFGQLSFIQKEKYIDFLMNNNIQFVENNKDFVAKIKIFTQPLQNIKTPEVQEIQNKKKQPEIIKTFNVQEIYMKKKLTETKNNEEKSKKKQMDRSTSAHIYRTNQSLDISCSPLKKVQTFKVLPKFEEHYPQFYRFIKQVDVWIHPKRISRELLCSIIEEIYDKRFHEATSQIQSKNIKTVIFPSFVYGYLSDKNKSETQIQQKAVDIVATVEQLCIKFQEIQIFQKFLQQKYAEEDLMFFLFVRAMVEKEIKCQLFQKNRKPPSIDQSSIFLNMKQVNSILDAVYGPDEMDKINRMSALCDQTMNTFKPNDPYQRKKRMTLQEFFHLSLNNFHQDRTSNRIQMNTRIEIQEREREKEKDKEKEKQKQQEKEKEKENNLSIGNYDRSKSKLVKLVSDIQTTICEEVFSQLQMFLNETVGIIEIQEEVQDILSDLLKAIFNFDKLIWFKRIFPNEAHEQDIIYIENLQKSFKQLQKNERKNQKADIVAYAKRIIQTPQLSTRIGKIIFKWQEYYQLNQ